MGDLLELPLIRAPVLLTIFKSTAYLSMLGIQNYKNEEYKVFK